MPTLKRLFARFLLVAAFVAIPIGTATTTALAGVSNCYTQPHTPYDGHWKGAVTTCSTGGTFSSIATRVRCTNGVTYQGNRIYEGWDPNTGVTRYSTVTCPYHSWAVSWYYAYWY